MTGLIACRIEGRFDATPFEARDGIRLAKRLRLRRRARSGPGRHRHAATADRTEAAGLGKRSRRARGRRIGWVRSLLLTALSGAVYALAFAPARLHALAWIALVPFLLALRDASLKRRLVLAAWLSLVVGWGTGTWMPGAVAGYFDQPLVVGFGLFLVVSLAMAAPYYMAFAAVYAPLVRRFGGVAAPLLAGRHGPAPTCCAAGS